MIDKISFIIQPYGEPPPGILIESVRTNTKTGEITRVGHLGNILITLVGNKLRGNGSFTKFHNGNNLVNPLYHNIRAGVEKLSDGLDTYPEDIQLEGGIEFAFNMDVSLKPISYMKKMFRLNQWERHFYPEKKTLCFTQGNSKTFKVYDKAAEYHKNEKKSDSFNPEIKTQKILRAELLMKRIWQLRLPYPGAQTLETLTKPEQLRKITDIYQSISEDIIFMKDFDYTIIDSINSGAISIRELKKIAQQEGFLSLIHKGADFEKCIESSKKSRQMKARDRKELRPKYNTPNFVTSEEEKEFREKLNEKISVFRESVY